MITPDYIERSNRKTLTLLVMKDGNIIVKAPLKMGDNEINQFVLEKQNWIKEKLMIVNQRNSKFEEIIKYKKFLLYGNRYTLLLSDVKKIETNDDFQIVLPQKTEPENILKVLKCWYKKIAKQILFDRLSFLESKVRLKSTSMKISDSRERWGSCNSNGTINFNWRVIMLPPAIIDYVIIHELCHLVEMNHSKNFWEKVYTFLPNAQKLKESIKEYGFLLSLFQEK